MADLSYLKYDTDKLIETRRIYKECIGTSNGEGLVGIQTRMQNMIDSLKDAWKSEAGEEFFNKYNDEWLKGFIQHKEVLNHMADNLYMAQGKYSEITCQVKALKLK